MRRFKVKGRIEVTYTWNIDEVVEVEDDENGDDAVEVILGELDTTEALDADTDTFGLDVEELDDTGEDLAQRQRRDREMLLAWNMGAPIPA